MLLTCFRYPALRVYKNKTLSTEKVSGRRHAMTAWVDNVTNPIIFIQGRRIEYKML